MQKILVIEDEFDLRENLLDLLSSEGFEAVSAEDGEAGVKLAQVMLPDLIICDVTMPELDGYGVLLRLRQTPATALIPFIFLTAKGTADDFRVGMRLGADDYLTKPFKQAELLEAIAIRLTRHATIRQLQQEAIQQLQQKLEELQQANLVKDDFLSIASHELRSPMTNIKMAIQMLQNPLGDECQKRYINLLQAECSREIDLLNDLLDLQRLEANVERPVIQKIYLPTCLPSLLKPFEARMAARQQVFQVEISPDVAFICFDVSDLNRILNELLNNACKYTAPGGTIRFSIKGQDPVRMMVSNEAEIPAAELSHVFERFYRVRSLDRWQQGGSGLGLTLVKQLVERGGGTITVASDDQWTEFCIEIPMLKQDLEH